MSDEEKDVTSEELPPPSDESSADDAMERTIIVDPEVVEQAHQAGVLLARKKAKLGAKTNSFIFVVNEGGGYQHNIKEDDHTVTIGNSREEADIVIANPETSKKQLVLVQVGGGWLFMDCGVKDMVSFNGVRIRQFAGPLDTRTVMKVSNKYLVFSGNQAVKDLHSEVSDLAGDFFHARLADNQMAQAELTVQLGMRELKSKGKPILIGKHDICDETLVGDNINYFHLMVFWGPEGIFVDPVMSFGILLNNEAISGIREVQPGDTIKIGNNDLSFSLTGDYKARCHELFAVEDIKFDSFGFTALANSKGDSFALPMDGAGVILGRSAGCDIKLEDEFVSRQHAQLIPGGKSVMVLDNYSVNGVFINGERINKARAHVGDILEIGQSYFLVHYA